MNIVNLVDDHKTNNQLESEHGLSFYIETKSHTILFDLGQSGLFLENAIKLDIDITKVDLVFISHGHYDHGGGLSAFLQCNQKAIIYIQDSAFNDYYSLREGGQVAYVGLDKTFSDHPRIKKMQGDYDVSKNLHVIQDVKNTRMFPKTNQSLFKAQKDLSKPDDFSHEQSLLIEEDGKRVLLTGCSHMGVINIIKAVNEKYNIEWLNAVIGGFHLKTRFKEYRYQKAELIHLSKMMKDKSKQFYTGHCTGEKAYKVIKAELGNQLEYFYPGWQITI